MIFVDTGGWYSAYIRKDRDHARVKPLIDEASDRLVTSDFVLAESLNLFRARGQFKRAVDLGQDLLGNVIAEVVRLTDQDLEQAFVIFSTYADKSWSFVDCTSFVLMQRLGIREAIALDEHFRQMAGIRVLP